MFKDLNELCKHYYDNKTYAHACDVAARVIPEYRNVALCHDLLEDTEVTIAELKAFLRFDEIISLALLSRKDENTYFDYIRVIKEYNDKAAMAVNIADLEDHIAKTETLSDSLRRRYTKALKILKT